jgi:uncharacterized delta-60 repeat protein
MVLDSSGRIIVVGRALNPVSHINNFAVMRFTSSGQPDDTFGPDPSRPGKKTIVFPGQIGDGAAQGVDIDVDGRIVVVGPARLSPGTSHFAVARLSGVDGQLDQSFGDDNSGMKTFQAPNQTTNNAQSVDAFQDSMGRSRILVSGWVRPQDGSNHFVSFS